jgi:hypothetical protein
MESQQKKKVTFNSHVSVEIHPSNEDDYCPWYSKEEIEIMRMKRHFDGLKLKNTIADYNAYTRCTSGTSNSITNLINYLSVAAPNFRGLETYMFPRAAHRQQVVQNILTLQEYYNHTLNHARYHEMECTVELKENIREYISNTYKDDTESSKHQARILAIYDAKLNKTEYKTLHMKTGLKRKLASSSNQTGKQETSKMKLSSEVLNVDQKPWSIRRMLLARMFGSCSDFP